MTLPAIPGSWQQVSGILLPRAEDGRLVTSVTRMAHRFPHNADANTSNGNAIAFGCS